MTLLTEVPAPPMLLTSKQAAVFLSICERKLWGLANDGDIPRVTIGRSVRYDRRDLIAWIDRQKEQPGDDHEQKRGSDGKRDH